MSNSNNLTVICALYGWNKSGGSICPAVNVTDIVQKLLAASTILNVNNQDLGGDPAPGEPKTFALLLSATGPDGTPVTRFATTREGTSIDVMTSGVVLPIPTVSSLMFR